jgi:C-methyltransferase C-terminal domain/Methyltransferase domain/Putative zinc binding domain
MTATPGCKAVTACRCCGGPLEAVLDLGAQHLAGQFPGPAEPDPPAYPLVLGHCAAGCGLVQLLHTVAGDLLFRDYWYRSSVSQTMREHLDGLAAQAVAALGRAPRRALDVGANDGTLLASLAGRSHCSCVGVDPAGVPPCAAAGPAVERLHGFYPHDALRGEKFDLVFSVACFYDADDPFAFARAVRDNLADGGLWVLEVADLGAVLARTGYDGVCHEHLTYFSPDTLRAVLARAGLEVVGLSQNAMNGGSLRAFARKAVAAAFGHAPPEHARRRRQGALAAFAGRVQKHREALRGYVLDCRDRGEEVHLLGASTKANTVLQYCGLSKELVRAASDRDPRKHGRRTPGTGIPVISEEGSRALGPDVYLTVLGHFRDELLEREKWFLRRGGRVAFALPALEEVRA